MNPVMRRLMREHKEMSNHPVREYRVMPLDENMFEWHFTITGPPDSPYAHGLYHGKVLVPTNYPFAPPDVVLMTPNGRFELDKKICLSISSYHPENWQSTWGVSTVLHALRQFMLTPGNSGIGAIEYPTETRVALAKESRTFCCAACGRSCADDWQQMQASPAATEAEINATVPSTPQMTPTQSSSSAMGSPQSSLAMAAAAAKESGTGAAPSAMAAPTASTASSTDAATAQLSPCNVGEPAIPPSTDAPPAVTLDGSSSAAAVSPVLNASEPAAAAAAAADAVSDGPVSAAAKEPVAPTATAPATTPVAQPAAPPPQAAAPPKTPVVAPALPPPRDPRRERMQQLQQQRQQPAVAARLGNDNRLEIQLSLELLDKLVTATALLLGLLITFRLAVSLADAETVAGRVFDHAVGAVLDILE